MNPKTNAEQPKPRLALAIATGLGLGYLPKAPGTWGSLLGVFLTGLAIETSITRKAPGGAGAAYGPGQAITLKQAIDMYTINAATQMGVADRLGTLEVGKQADFIVIERDPFQVPVTDLHKVKVEQTYVGGSKVFDRTASGTSR